jgi:hypothetical protein
VWPEDETAGDVLGRRRRIVGRQRVREARVDGDDVRLLPDLQ